MLLIDGGDGIVDFPAHLVLVLLAVAFKDDAHGIEVVHLREGDVLGLHLVPYGVHRLYTSLCLEFEAHGFETLHDGGGEIGIHLVAVRLRVFDFCLDVGVGGRVLVFERQVFELGLYLEQPQAVGQGSVDVERLSGNLVLLVGSHRPEGAHIVEAVGHLDKHHADIVAHGEEQFAEVLGLGGGAVAEDTA